MGEPVSYCRIFQVGPACPHLCADCKAADKQLTDADRARLLGGTVYAPPVRSFLNVAGWWAVAFFALTFAAFLGGAFR